MLPVDPDGMLQEHTTDLEERVIDVQRGATVKTGRLQRLVSEIQLSAKT